MDTSPRPLSRRVSRPATELVALLRVVAFTSALALSVLVVAWLLHLAARAFVAAPGAGALTLAGALVVAAGAAARRVGEDAAGTRLAPVVELHRERALRSGR